MGPQLQGGQEVDLSALEAIMSSGVRTRQALIPMLQKVQEHYRYVPKEVIPRIAKALGLFPAEVQGVVTFYTQFSLKPRGRNLVRVCRGTACNVRGGRGVLRVVRKALGVEEGETTEDLKFTLETVACLGACALAPVVVLNNCCHGQMNPRRIEAILQVP